MLQTCFALFYYVNITEERKKKGCDLLEQICTTRSADLYVLGELS